MNRKLLITAGIIGAVLTAAIVYVLVTKMNRTPQPAQTTVTEQVQQPEVAPENTVTQPQPGAYTEYSAAAVGSTKGVKVLFFHAQWCPQCRQLDSQITAGPLPQNVTIFKVNYDTAQELRQKYGVTLQTTFVKIDDNGNLVKKYVAYDEPTLAALIRNIL